jgi:hypothetical protein
VALLLNQSAFEAAPLDASLPAITVAEPLAGIAFGVGVYGEHLTLSGPLLAVELLGVAAMVAGVVIVARSPVVTMGSRAGSRPPDGLPPGGRPGDGESCDDSPRAWQAAPESGVAAGPGRVRRDGEGASS